MPSTTMQDRFDRICREMGYAPAEKKCKKTWAEVQAEKWGSDAEALEMSGRALDEEDQPEPYKDPYAIDYDNEEKA